VPLTINSNADPYCTPAQFVVVDDWRAYAQLASDTDVPLASSALLQASPVLLAALQEGAGDIESACAMGQRYPPASLVTLVTADPMTLKICNSGWAIIRINAAMAAYYMYDRRQETMPEQIEKKVERAMAQLEALANGMAVLGFLESQEAGVLQDYLETPQDVIARQMPSWTARPCFGIRNNVSNPPWGRGTR
jgi:hypothetical protein